jgi:hypothetical protein
MEAKYFCFSRKTICLATGFFQSFLIHKAQSTPLWDPSGPLEETIERNTTRPSQQTTLSVPGLSICSPSPSLAEMAYLVSESFVKSFLPKRGQQENNGIFLSQSRNKLCLKTGFSKFFLSVKTIFLSQPRS